mgnify:FL=1
MSSPSITADLSNNVIVAISGNTNNTLTINYSITPLSPYKSALLITPPTGELNLLSLKFSTQASSELKVGGSLYINGDIKNTQQEWFDLLPFFSGYFVDNEYHDGGPQAHRNKVYKLSFILDSLQYNNVTTIFPNDYRTQNPNPQPALRHDQATTYHLTKIKEIGEYTVTFYIKSVSIYGQSKKVISNANGDIVNYFNITFTDEIQDQPTKTYECWVNGQYAQYINGQSVYPVNYSNNYKFPSSILNNFAGIFRNISTNELYNIVWNILTDGSGNKYVQPLINNSGTFIEFSEGSKNLSKELNGEFLDTGLNLTKTYNADLKYLGEHIISLKVPKYVTGSTFLTTISNNFEIKDLSLNITDRPLLSVSLSSLLKNIYVGNQINIDVSYNGLQSGLISYPGVTDISLNTLKFKLLSGTLVQNTNMIYNKINNTIEYNGVNIITPNWGNIEYLKGIYMDKRNGNLYNFQNFGINNGVTLLVQSNPQLSYSNLLYEYELVQVSVDISTLSLSIDASNFVINNIVTLNGVQLTSGDINKFLYIRGNFINNVNNNIYNLIFSIDNSNLKVTSSPALSSNNIYNLTYLNKNDKLDLTLNKISYTGESTLMGSNNIRLLSFAPDGYIKESDLSYNFNVYTPATIDASLNRNLISIIQSDNITTLNVNYNISNLAGNQSIIIQKPPVNSRVLGSIKFKIGSREGSTNNYFISGGITINDIDYNNVNEWNDIYTWLDGYYVNNLDRTLYGGNKLKIEFRQHGQDTLKILTDRNDLEIGDFLYFTKLENINNYVVQFKTGVHSSLIFGDYTENDNNFKIYNTIEDASNNTNIINTSATDYSQIFNNLTNSSILKDVSSNILYTITTTQQTINSQVNVVVFTSTPALNSNTFYRFELIHNSEKLNNVTGSYTYTADSNYIGEQEISITIPKYGIDVSSNNSFIRKDLSFNVLDKGILTFDISQNSTPVKINNTIDISFAINHGVSGIVSNPGTSDLSLNSMKFKVQNWLYNNEYNTIASSITYNNVSISQDEWSNLIYLKGQYMDVNNGNLYILEDITLASNGNILYFKSNPQLPYNNQNYEFNLRQLSLSIDTIKFTINSSENNVHYLNGNIIIDNDYLSFQNIKKIKYISGTYLDELSNKLYTIDSFDTSNNNIIINSNNNYNLNNLYTLKRVKTNNKLDISQTKYTYTGNEKYIGNQKIKFYAYGEGYVLEVIKTANIVILGDFTNLPFTTELYWLKKIDFTNLGFNCYDIDMVYKDRINYYILSGYFSNNVELDNIYIKEDQINNTISKINIGNQFDYSKIKIMEFPSSITNTSGTLVNCNLLIGLKKETINGVNNSLSIETRVINKSSGLFETNWSSSSKDIDIQYLPVILNSKDISIESNFYSGLTGTGITPQNETTIMKTKLKADMTKNSVQPVQGQTTDFYIKVNDVDNDLKVGMKGGISGNTGTITNVSIGVINDIEYWYIRFGGDWGTSIPGLNTIFNYNINVTANDNWINMIKIVYRDGTKSGYPMGVLTYCIRFTSSGLVDKIGMVTNKIVSTNYVPSYYNSINSSLGIFRDNEDIQQVENGAFYYYNNLLLRSTKIKNLIFNTNSFNNNELGTNEITLTGKKISNQVEEFIDSSILQKGSVIVSRAIGTSNTKGFFSGKKAYKLNYDTSNNITIEELGDTLTNQDSDKPKGYNYIDSRMILNTLINTPTWMDIIKDDNNKINFELKYSHDTPFYKDEVNNDLNKNWGAIYKNDSSNNLYAVTINNNILKFITLSLNIDPVPTSLSQSQYEKVRDAYAAVNSNVKIIWKCRSTFATSYKLKLFKEDQLEKTIIVPATLNEYQTYNAVLKEFNLVETDWDQCGNQNCTISATITTIIDYTSQSGLSQFESGAGTFSILLPKILLTECKPQVLYSESSSNVEPNESNKMKTAKRLSLASNRYYRR